MFKVDTTLIFNYNSNIYVTESRAILCSDFNGDNKRSYSTSGKPADLGIFNNVVYYVENNSTLRRYSMEQLLACFYLQIC